MTPIKTYCVAAALLLLLAGLSVPVILETLRGAQGYVFETDDSTTLLAQTICLAGDTGKGSLKQEQLSQQMVRAGCTEIRLLGDLIYPDGLTGPGDPQYAEKFATPFHSSIDAGLPFYVLLGNHDYNNDAPEAWLEIGQREPWLNHPAHYYAERRSGLCIVSLDSTTYEKLYRVPDRVAQSLWLDGVRNEHQPFCDFSLLLAHHPYDSPGRHGEALPQLKLFYDREVIGHFDLLVSGHDHILADVGQHQGTHQFISGAGSKVDRLEPDSPDVPYAQAEIGFIALSFQSEGTALVANARFIVLSGSRMEERWHRRIVGKGWRGESPQ